MLSLGKKKKTSRSLFYGGSGVGKVPSTSSGIILYIYIYLGIYIYRDIGYVRKDDLVCKNRYRYAKSRP